MSSFMVIIRQERIGILPAKKSGNDQVSPSLKTNYIIASENWWETRCQFTAHGIQPFFPCMSSIWNGE